MPPAVTAIVGAALATLIGGPISATIGWVASFLIRAGVGLLLNALSKQKDQGKRPGANAGYQVTARGSNLVHQLIYGDVKVHGAEVFRESNGLDNKYFHQVLVFAGHEIDSYVEFWVDDYLVTTDVNDHVDSATKNDTTTTDKYNGKIRIKPHYGSDTQAADAHLAATSGHWNYQCNLYGLAYLYIRFTFDKDAYPNGIPVISARIKGKKVFDSRDGAQSEANPTTWTWSDNPALCLRDYMRGDHGVGEQSSVIDNNLLMAAADDCDVLVSGSKKFVLNGAFLSDVKPIDHIPDMLSCMAGMSWYGQGKWRVRAGVWTPPVMDLGDDDLRSPLQVNPRHSSRDSFNTIKGQFRGPESDWQETDYPEVSHPAFVTEDGGEISVLNIDQPFTTDSVQARRVARILLEGHRQQIVVQASFGLRVMGVQVGDNIRLTNARFGWTNKEFQVVSWAFDIVGSDEAPDIQVKLTLNETAQSVYDEVADGVVYLRDNTTLPSAFLVPAVGVTLSARMQIVAQKVTTVISVDVTSGSPDQIDRVEVEYKLSTDSAWTVVGTGQLGRFEIFDATAAFYDVRARGINTFGVRGDWTTRNNFQPQVASIPNDVTGFTAVVNRAAVDLKWDAAVDLDLSHYMIRHAAEVTGATWANATTAVEKIGRPATSISVPARPGTYMIRAISKSGVYSQNYTSSVVPDADMETFATNSFNYMSTTFYGTKDSVGVTSGELRISLPSDGDGLLTYSEDMNTAPNTVVNTAVTANNTTAPDGALTADLIKPDTATGSLPHNMLQAATVLKDTWYNYSVYAKADVIGVIRLRAFHSSGNVDEATFDLANGVIITAGVVTNIDAAMSDEGNGWYRCSISVFNLIDTSTNFESFLMLTANNVGETYDGTVDTGGLWLWGVQATLGQFLRPYHLVGASVINDHGDYTWSGTVDTGAVRRVRSRMDVFVYRKDSSSILVDDLQGYVDAQVGLWDDLTPNPQTDDTDVLTFIRATDDNPSGTPVWGPWRQYLAGEFSGRAFQFKATLKTKSHNVTPSITMLRGKVQY